VDKIIIRGAREHNLKNISLEIPRGQLVVITGVSGSGKSSLAFDTIYAEGQRRYVESLSAYVRQFLSQRARPDVDSIEGLSPAIAIEQRSISKNPRSTVGTVTEIADYLRLLFARVGTPFCPRCGRQISAHSIPQMVDRILVLPQGSQVHILAPLAQRRSGGTGLKPVLLKELRELRKAGFVRVVIDGTFHNLEEDEVPVDPHIVDLLVDRLAIKPGVQRRLATRLADSLETALRYGNDVVKVKTLGGEEWLFTQKLVCPQCGVSHPELTPRLFSFNSPEGACPACRGLGFCADRDRDRDKEGVVGWSLSDSSVSAMACSTCQGTRLRAESCLVRIQGKNIAQVSAMPLKEAYTFFSSLLLGPQQAEVARPVLREIIDRLGFLLDVGLDYLTLDRPSATLSSGEGQRIRLATQIGSGLSGVLYILDEPSVGLHQKDTAQLLAALKRLQGLGNSVLVVEHDREVILAADFVVDLGPGAGEQGGQVIAQGNPQEVMAHPHSLTGRYLREELTLPLPSRCRLQDRGRLIIKGARQHNLRGISVSIPLGKMTCVTGVSGSGKSSLVIDTLYRHLAFLLHGKKAEGRDVDEVSGWQSIERIVRVDQTSIGRTPRSNPATYTGLFTPLRELFAQLPEARVRGYTPERFSFNARGGRCEACCGDGVTAVEMHFLPDVYVTCEVCQGRRYNRETLEVKYKGKSIAEVLDLTVAQALAFLGAIPAIRSRLETLRDVGLDYLCLGQPAPTLSGGEAQRVKLARELSRRSGGQTLYILDEPTTGLHFADVARLLEVLQQLVDSGNTVIIIEHNLDVIRAADFIIDLGPGAGEKGGEVVVVGTPEEVAYCPSSYTGEFLRRFFSSPPCHS
jgi:excinuclease ABC subunit A